MRSRLVKMLLAAHPTSFRARFGDEIMAVYEEIYGDANAEAIFDMAASCMRQWIRALQNPTQTPAAMTNRGLVEYLDLSLERPRAMRFIQSVSLIAAAVAILWAAQPHH